MQFRRCDGSAQSLRRLRRVALASVLTYGAATGVSTFTVVSTAVRSEPPGAALEVDASDRQKEDEHGRYVAVGE